MTYFKPIEATCRKCRNDKRRRIYRVRHDLGGARNRVTIFCDHSKPHYTGASIKFEHVAGLQKQVQDVKRYPTRLTQCTHCGRTIHQRGWMPVDSPQKQIEVFLRGYPLPGNFVCGEVCFKAALAAQARTRRAARPEARCRNCGGVFIARRGAKFCSTRCRVAGHRARHKEAVE